MKKGILSILFLFLFVSAIFSQIIFQENFENKVMPDGWTVQSKASDGGWKIGAASTLKSKDFNIKSNGSKGIAATNDDKCNCDKSNEYLVTPAIDLSSVTSAALKVDVYYLDASYKADQEDASVEVSLDGINWTKLEDLHGHGNWDTHTLNLSAYAGESTVYIGFRFDDAGAWLFGCAIDNVVVEVPVGLDAKLVDLSANKYGEKGVAIPIGGYIFNNGVTTISSLKVSYKINGENPIVELIDNMDVEAFQYAEFTLPTPWIPVGNGEYNIQAEIVEVNGMKDEDSDNNIGSFSTEIFDKVDVPNKMDDFVKYEAILTEITEASGYLDKPNDLDFFPILGKNELWVVNERNENSGGRTLTISDATDENPSKFDSRTDGNAWHFMALPTGIAFSSENGNFATSPGIKDANHNGGTFTGPTLWSSDPDIYAKPSGGNGSHLDMLHGSPYSMGIAHEVDNVFWVYDNFNNDIVRYDFADDHGPGNADHDDGVVHRYKGLGIEADGNIPNHLILDKKTNWLYFVDNGNKRVLRLDISSGTPTAIPLINEVLKEHTSISGYTSEVIIKNGLDQPCGIEIFENRLLVGDYATGDITIYDMENNFARLGRIVTGKKGLTGIKVGPDGNIWFTNRLQNTLMKAEPSDVVGAMDLFNLELNVSPNPTQGKLSINLPSLDENAKFNLQLTTITGQEIMNENRVGAFQNLNLENLPNGIYMLDISGDNFKGKEKIVLNK